MNRKANFAEGSVKLVIQALAGRFGYKVEFGHFSTASISFEERKFRFPYMPLTLSKREQDRLFGFMWHELSHLEFTDPEAIKSVLPQAAGIFNCLEDPSMESRQNKKNLYARKRMETLTTILIEDGLVPATTAKDTPIDVLSWYLNNWGYAHIAGHSAALPLAEKCEDTFIKVFGKPFHLKVKSLLTKIGDVTSHEIAMLSNNFFNMIKDQVEKDTKERNQQPQMMGGDGNGKGSGSGDPVQPTPEQQQMMNLLQQLSSGQQTQTDTRSQYEAPQPTQQQDEPFQYEEPGQPTVSNYYDLSPFKKLPALALQVKRSFQSKNKRNKRRTASGRKLTKKFPLAVTTYDKRIFTQCTESKAINTHVSFAWDISGSMRGDEYDVSKETLVSLVDACERTRDMSTSVCAFPYRSAQKKVFPIKVRTQRLDSISGNFAIEAQGNTPTAEALYWCYEQCFTAPEKRKILIVITDGSPNSGGHIPMINRLCEQAGIEVYAIGIRSDKVRNYWREWTEIDDLSQLAPKLASLIAPL